MICTLAIQPFFSHFSDSPIAHSDFHMYIQTGKNNKWTHMQAWTSICMHKYTHSTWIRFQSPQCLSPSTFKHICTHTYIHLLLCRIGKTDKIQNRSIYINTNKSIKHFITRKSTLVEICKDGNGLHFKLLPYVSVSAGKACKNSPLLAAHLPLLLGHLTQGHDLQQLSCHTYLTFVWKSLICKAIKLR